MSIKEYSKMTAKVAREENRKAERAARLNRLYSFSINPSLIGKITSKGVN